MSSFSDALAISVLPEAVKVLHSEAAEKLGKSVSQSIASVIACHTPGNVCRRPCARVADTCQERCAERWTLVGALTSVINRTR